MPDNYEFRCLNDEAVKWCKTYKHYLGSGGKGFDGSVCVGCCWATWGKNKAVPAKIDLVYSLEWNWFVGGGLQSLSGRRER